MSNKTRQKIQVQTVTDASKLGQISKKELLADSEKYDADNYDPLKNLSEKEVLIPTNKSEVVTIRLSQQENKLITDLADENGLSKSAFIRMVVKRAIKEQEYQ
jgi:predicted DNA binding CopG/RHH family protein